MFRKQSLFVFPKSFYSKFEFPTKETVCQNKPEVAPAEKPVVDGGPLTSDQVVCPWKQTKETKQPEVGGGPGPVDDQLDKFQTVWRSLTLYLCLPVVVLMSAAVLLGDHDEPRPEFVPYTHLRLRYKAFPWGDGNKSLFHNPHKNALPDGYEDENDDEVED